MTQPASAAASAHLAPEVPDAGLRTLEAPRLRPGFAIFVPGESLKVGSKLWTEAQREAGVFVRGAFLTASEEEECIVEAQRENKIAAIGAFQVRRSLAYVADVQMVDNGQGGQRPTPGAWRVIPFLERRSYWEELGSQGRGFFTTAYQLAHSPSQAAHEVALASFCTIT